MTPVYVVELGPNLYVSGGRAFLMAQTTRNITDAQWFLDEMTADRVAKKNHGSVQKFILERAEERDSELDMLRSAVIELQRERDELLTQGETDAGSETGTD